MTLATLIVLAVTASIFLGVLALGMSTSTSDATYVLRRPGLLLRSLLAMNVIMPLFAAVLAAAFDLRPAVKIALIALAVSPVPPLLPKRELKAEGDASYAIGLLGAAAVLAIVLIPISVTLLARLFGRDLHVPVGTVASIVGSTILVPLAAGLALRHFAPGASGRLVKPLAVAGTVLLVVAAVPILVAAWPSILALIGNGTVLTLAVFAAVGLAVGHALGGPDPDERSVLALSTASRHPALAIGIGAVALADPRPVMGAVLLYVLVATLVTLPYIKRRPGAGVGGAVVDRPVVVGHARTRRAAV